MYEPRRDGVWRHRLDCLLDLTFAPTCLSCARPAPRGLEVLGLCSRCRLLLESLRRTGCASCGRPLAAASPPPGFRCSHCRRQPPAYDHLTALWSYEPPIDSVLRALKFSARFGLAAPLGRCLAQRLVRERRTLEFVVPVPLHWRRRLSRGFDQAEEIARTVAKELRLPFARPLRRRRATVAQSRLALDQRRGNVTNAFAVRPRRLPFGASVLLVDDVVTSGATLHAAAITLRCLDASSIHAAVIARTPEPGEPPSLPKLGQK